MMWDMCMLIKSKLFFGALIAIDKEIKAEGGDAPP